MLERLVIQNYVIIEEQEIQFSNGLNIITGETGAGKSIILGALTLVLGARAESRVLLDDMKKAVVEAIFTNYPKQLDKILGDGDVDLGDEIIMRREILPSGKSRAFVNDTPVRLEFMRKISGGLLDLHQQFETLEIQDRSHQYDTLDAFADLDDIGKNYRSLHSKLIALNSKVKRLTEERTRAAQERDYVEFQYQELSNVLPEPGQLQIWESDFELQEHAEEIKSCLIKSVAMLRDEDRAILDALRTLNSELSEFQHTGLSSIAERMTSSILEIEDIVNELEALESGFEADPGLKAELEEKIDSIRRLYIKHGLQSEEQLIELTESLRAKLEGWDAAGNDLEKAIAERDQTRLDLEKLADKLYKSRKKSAKPLAEEVGSMLKELEMKNARFEIGLDKVPELHERGQDRIDFLFAANKGSSLEPVGKVASGGELSRLSLCIKSVVCKKMQLPSMVFDEIDSGVSGQVALKMGVLLRELAEVHQVIMITHSPQIAARAGRHLRVAKFDTSERSFARINMLTDEERIFEVAKMLSGDPPTDAAVLNAKELINH